MLRPSISLLIALVALSYAMVASAHDFRPGVLSLSELDRGRFALVWSEPVDSSASSAEEVVVRFPERCRRTGEILECGELDGVIAFERLAPRMRVVVVIRWRDGRELEQVVSGEAPQLSLTAARSALSWVGLGAEHVVRGFDHLAFLVGLLLLLRPDRRLVLTITAFTLAHSLTLALAVLDVVALPSAPVEATIAASVVLVARESLDDAPSVTKSAPWVVALLFGLVHGLGFAGALRELGLPSGSVGWTLLSFNVGVELGQLAVVALFLAARRLGGERMPGWLRPAVAYALGTLGALWLVGRTIQCFTASFTGS